MSTGKFWLYYDPQPSPESRLFIEQYESAKLCVWAAEERVKNVTGKIEDYYVFEIDENSGVTLNGWRADDEAIAGDLPLFSEDDFIFYKGLIFRVHEVDYFNGKVYIQQIVRLGNGRIIEFDIENLKSSRKVRNIK